MTEVDDLDRWQRRSVGLTTSAELVNLERDARYAIAVAARYIINLYSVNTPLIGYYFILGPTMVSDAYRKGSTKKSVLKMLS